MRLATALLLALLTISAFNVPAALAHTGTGSGFAMLDGLMHPLMGIDHLVTMIGVGLWAAIAGGKARWLWPAAFVMMMIAGGALALHEYSVPYVEATILASVIGIGTAVAFGLRLPLALGAAVCGAFAVAHGYAHGSELPAGASAAGYVAGFVVATALLHATGIAAGLALQRPAWVTRAVGAGIAAAGIAMAFA